MNVKKLKKKMGQNTAEYLILLVLVAVGSIGIFTVFSDMLRKQISNVVAAFSGQEEMHDVKGHAKEAHDRAAKGMAMDGVEGEEVVKYTGDGGGN